jgi:hypothetical protein
MVLIGGKPPNPLGPLRGDWVRCELLVTVRLFLLFFFCWKIDVSVESGEKRIILQLTTKRVLQWKNTLCF